MRYQYIPTRKVGMIKKQTSPPKKPTTTTNNKNLTTPNAGQDAENQTHYW